MTHHMDSMKKEDKKYIESLTKEIVRLKKKRNAIIMVHNYQRDEIQNIADISGDSLALSEAAVKTNVDVIVFCGVHFMAESASILNPKKKVLLPVKEAGCPLADMVGVEELRAKRKEFPDAAVVCYVNSNAEVKAESDIGCTSSNAVAVVRSLPNKRIIFVPDKNLARFVQSQVPEKEIIAWEGFCPTHIVLKGEDITKAKKIHPKAEVIAHPECSSEIQDIADHICSTASMFKYVKSSKAKEFIIGTESGMLYKLRKENPDKIFYLPSEHLVCPNMKLTTLGWVTRSLELMVHEVKVPKKIAERARVSLEKMLKITGERSGATISGV